MPETFHAVHWRDLELLLAAHGVLQEDSGGFYAQVWGKDKLESLSRTYPLLFEVTRAMTLRYSLWGLEPLLLYPMERFSLADYAAFLDELTPEELIRAALALDFCPEWDSGRIALARSDDAVAQALLAQMDREREIPFLAFRTFLHQVKDLAAQLMALARDLDDGDFAGTLDRYGSQLRQELRTMERDLETAPPLDYSERRMGKTFRNRGPYEEYWFVPVVFLHYRACRLARPGEFARVQILLLSQRTGEAGEKAAVRRLKAMADEGRFKIMTLLAQGEALRGMDIAKRLKLAPSTVSHHMDQLRQAGLIHEETTREGKYYSLNKPGVQSLLETLEHRFGSAGDG